MSVTVGRGKRKQCGVERRWDEILEFSRRGESLSLNIEYWIWELWPCLSVYDQSSKSITSYEGSWGACGLNWIQLDADNFSAATLMRISVDDSVSIPAIAWGGAVAIVPPRVSVARRWIARSPRDANRFVNNLPIIGHFSRYIHDALIRACKVGRVFVTHLVV